jgi:hypothetical protein
LAADDWLSGLGEEPRFRVRETHGWKLWKLHAADLEAEMISRGMIFDLIDRSEEDQAKLPFEEGGSA